MRRRDFLAGTAAGAAASLAAPRIASAADARVLKFIPQADLVVVDPIWTAAHVTRHHAFLVFDTLYGQDSATAVSPQMLAGALTEDDGKLWTLTLRPGLLFHDGTPVLARDCVASIRRWGQRDIMGRLLLAATAELSAPDDRTIRFRLARPFPQLPLALGKSGRQCLRDDAGTPGRDRRLHPGDGDGRQRPVPLQRRRAHSGARFVYERFAAYQPRDGVADFMAGPKPVHFDRVEWLVNPDPAPPSQRCRRARWIGSNNPCWTCCPSCGQTARSRPPSWTCWATSASSG